MKQLAKMAGLNSVYVWTGIPINSANNMCFSIADIKVDDFRHVYLDHNATTYLREEIIKLLENFYEDKLAFGNPSSSTFLGKNAYELINTARYQIAECLDVKQEEIIFTGSGTEANNLAIKGIAFKNADKKGHIITSKIEHPSVLETVRWLEKFGFEATYLDVDSKGFVSPEDVKKNIKQDTILVAVMSANNEIGTLQPIKEIGEICSSHSIPFMTDAVQEFGHIKVKPKEVGISLMSISAHKIYGPKGAGALYVDEKVSLTPIIHGGKQEFGIRAGTENAGSIIAFGKAAKLIYKEMEEENNRLLKLQEYFLSKIREIVPDYSINGPLDKRLPNNLSINFPGIDSGILLLYLNKAGIYVSSGSACSSGSNEYSHVLSAIGLTREKYGTIRFSFGLKTTEDDLDYLFRYLKIILEKIKQ
jgi:cysteine desulfurase